MKIAAVGDLHVQEKRLDGPGGHREIVMAVANSIVKSEAEVCLLAGDLSGTTVPHRASIAERNLVMDFVKRISEAMPVVICRGNHDSDGDWAFLNEVRGKRDGGRLTSPILYVEQPEVLEFSGFVIVVLPWLDEAKLKNPNKTSWSRLVKDAYKDAMEGVTGDKPTFVLTHGAFEGAFLREGQPTVPTTDPVLHIDTFVDPSTVKAVFAGHYHQFQRIPGRTKAFYCGSLFANTFGESEEKGWVLWTTERGHQLVQVEQPLRVKVTFDTSTDRVKDVEPPVLPWIGKSVEDVKGYLETKRQGRHQIKIAFSATEAEAPKFVEHLQDMQSIVRKQGGRLEVKADIERVSNTREGARKVTKAKSLDQKFVEWANQLSSPPEPARLERAVKMLRKAST